MAPELGIDVAKGRVGRCCGCKVPGCDEQAPSGRGLKVSTAIAEGLPAGAILEYAKENNASLIALATHGRGGLARAVMGSVADAVGRHSEVPILLVRVRAEDL
jgi:nucleotide-binding universal stress UspA family protein